MKRFLILALAALGLVIAAPSALAFTRHVVFDPTPSLATIPAVPPVACTSDTPCNFGVPGLPYIVNFLPCTDVLGATTSTAGYNYCLWMNNVTGQALSTFTFQFAVPPGEAAGDTLECISSPASLATADCPATLPSSGDLLTVSFFADPALPNPTDFYLFTDFTNSPGTATVTASVPEPSGLGLFGLGLLALGLGFGWQKRRQLARGHGAA